MPKESESNFVQFFLFFRSPSEFRIFYPPFLRASCRILEESDQKPRVVEFPCNFWNPPFTHKSHKFPWLVYLYPRTLFVVTLFPSFPPAFYISAFYASSYLIIYRSKCLEGRYAFRVHTNGHHFRPFSGVFVNSTLFTKKSEIFVAFLTSLVSSLVLISNKPTARLLFIKGSKYSSLTLYLHLYLLSSKFHCLTVLPYRLLPNSTSK